MNDSKETKNEEVQDDKIKEGAKPTTESKSSSSETKDTAKDTIRFQLRNDKLMWNSKSRNIQLSAFRQETGGVVSRKKNPEDYESVKKAIELEILDKVPEGEDFIKFESKDLTSGAAQAAREEKIRKQYTTDEILKLKQEEALAKIDEIEDPRHLIALIQAEKHGKNETDVERPNVLNRLRDRLQDVDTQGLYEYDGEL